MLSASVGERAGDTRDSNGRWTGANSGVPLLEGGRGAILKDLRLGAPG